MECLPRVVNKSARVSGDDRLECRGLLIDFPQSGQIFPLSRIGAISSTFLVIAESGILRASKALLNPFTDGGGIVDAAKPGGMQILVGVGRMAHLASATGRIDAEVREPKDSLNWPLGNGDVLDIREGYRHFLNSDDALADAQTAVGNDVPALFIIQAEDRQTKQALKQGQKEDHQRNAQHEYSFRMRFLFHEGGDSQKNSRGYEYRNNHSRGLK